MAAPVAKALPTPGMPITPFPHNCDSTARGRPIPVTLTEAGLDSPTFRASAAYYSDQIEAVERWLDIATRTAGKLTQEILSLEDSINLYLNKLTPPMAIAESMMDQDYTLLALKRVSDASRDWWMQVLSMMRKMNATMVDPVRQYINGDLKAFKDARRALETTQKAFDQALARYASQNKTKEPSFLREEAFAVHETRKAYLKACMDFCVLGPQARASLDKLMVRQCFDLAREVKLSREITRNSELWTEDLDRIRGWSKEMEAAEPTFKRELATICREIGDAAIMVYRPSRELEAYSASTVPFLGSRGPMSGIQTGKPSTDSATAMSTIIERQGWLFLKSVLGKPARPQWVRRWFYCRDGVFGSLQHNAQGVFQDDEVGVLLCSAKPALSEERRFCFEVKTKISTLVLQAETQQQLSEWLHVFEAAKKHALEASTSKDSIPMRTGSDPAFSIKPPSAPEFSTRNIDAATATALALDDSALAVPSIEPALTSRASIDMYGSQAPRRSFTAAIGRDTEDHHSSTRIMSRRDLHRKNTFHAMDPPQSAGHGPAGGIASLISGIPIGTPSNNKGFVAAAAAAAMGQIDMPPGSLAPLTPPRPPLGTNMTRAAVQAATDRSVAMGVPHQLPAFLLANFWGSNAWSSFYADGQLDYKKEEERALALAASEGKHVTTTLPSGASHRKTMSADMIQPTLISEKLDLKPQKPKPQHLLGLPSQLQEIFPPGYPPELKAQNASFRLLFPSVPMSEKLVLVFRGAWSSTRGASAGSDAGETKLTATGRVFVTPDSLHFYGHRMGLLVAFSLSLDLVSEITSAPGKDCDYLFLHLTNCPSHDTNAKEKAKPSSDTGLSRITITTFLENLPLLQARLNVLMDNLQAEEPMDIQDITGTFIDMERGHDSRMPDSPNGSLSVGSWEEVEQPPLAPITLALPPAVVARAEKQAHERQPHSPHIGRAGPPLSPGISRVMMGSRRSTGLSTTTRSRGNTTGRLLPRGPTGYEPNDMKKKVCERHFDIGAKACFHVVFGDRSYIFARLYNQRQASNIEQRPWTLSEEGGRMRREFKYRADTMDMLGRSRIEDIIDYQTIDMFTDHSTYVVSHVSTAWHLPFSSHLRVVTKMVITHEAKSRCKMTFYTRTDWASTAPPLGKRMVDKQAMDDAAAVVEAMADAVTEQIHKLGAHSRTKKAIQVYGHIGGITQTVMYAHDASAADVTVSSAKGSMASTSATATQGSGGGQSKGSSNNGGVRVAGGTGNNNTSKAPSVRHRTLTKMAFDTVFSFAESIVTSVLMSVFAVMQSLFRVLSAHRVLLGLLVASVLLNVLMTGKETSSWWTERRAARFMQRIGVGPNVVMSRAVRWEDLGAAVGSGSGPLWHRESECYASFQAVVNASDPDALLDSTTGAGPHSLLLTTPHSQQTSRRIHRTRQRLGAYRHDLLVAMRVVNRIEREMEMAEWEAWVADENQRCAQLRYALDVSDTAATAATADSGSGDGAPGQPAASKPDRLDERRAALGLWYEDYCGSCRADARALAGEQDA